MGKQFYAHSLEDKPPEKWQLLEDQLEAVAKMSADFARRLETKVGRVSQDCGMTQVNTQMIFKQN